MFKKIRQNGQYIGLIIALAGLVGSLYFSEIMGLTPCLLCWYQRIALYPLVAIFAVGIIKKSQEAWDYAITFIVAGLIIGLYQLLLVYQLIPEATATCAIGIPCSRVDWALFGFINIPLMAFLSFVLLGAIYLISKRK